MGSGTQLSCLLRCRLWAMMFSRASLPNSILSRISEGLVRFLCALNSAWAFAFTKSLLFGVGNLALSRSIFL
uniref:Uncharacterized protein n=1 Tax=Arcella intermedia TaxID=1963864 RepID=A0A6B2LY43_9EUKA